MEKNHLIQRITDEKDTRTKKILLNPRTKEIFKQNELKLERMEKQILVQISQEDIQVFLKVIDQMKSNLEQKNK